MVCWRVSIRVEDRKMGYPQNNDVRGRILRESDRCQNSIMETLRDVKICLTSLKQ